MTYEAQHFDPQLWRRALYRRGTNILSQVPSSQPRLVRISYSGNSKHSDSCHESIFFSAMLVKFHKSKREEKQNPDYNRIRDPN